MNTANTLPKKNQLSLFKLIGFSLLVMNFLTGTALAQDQTVTITTSGQGATLEIAQQNALRSAIEQSFGAFISTRTEILNDELVSDEIASVSSGNIQMYEVLDETKLSDEKWATTLRAVVSVTKLTSFVQARGVQVEIQGGLFAANIKQQLLNEQAEQRAVRMMVGVLHEILQTAFDYSIEAGDPVATDATSSNWEIPLTVTATANKNMSVAAEYFHNTMQALSLSDEEVDSYRSLNKQVFRVINRTILPTSRWNRSSQVVYLLRTEDSFNTVNYIANNLPGAYLRLFVVDSGLDKMQGIGEMSRNHTFSENEPESNRLSIHFLKSGERAVTFEWKDLRSLTEIEQITAYSVESRNVVSPTIAGDVTNPKTGKTWMDRNLGAMWVAISSKDKGAYGDLYQWGRSSDGHEKRTSGTTREKSSTATPGHGEFIGSQRGWHSANSQEKLWEGVNGVNNPCPSGYRLPTEAEWAEELQSWDKSLKSQDAAFTSPLKLTVAGYRNGGGQLNSGPHGNYWSSSVGLYESSGLEFFLNRLVVSESTQNLGYSVRCIRD